MKVLDKGSKGQVLVLVALMMVMLLGIAALAIDIGRAYGVRAKLNAAVDAASFEAANALAQGSGESGMRAKALQVAANYFSANYNSEGFMGATPSAPTVTANRDGNTGAWTVNVAATATMPTMFAGVLGLSSLDIAAASETVRGTLDIALVLDASSSMTSKFPEVQIRAKEFVKLFAELDDRIGLVAFSSGAYPTVSICGVNDPNPIQNPEPNSLSCGRGYNQETVKRAIDNLEASGMTASEEGLKKALDQLNALQTDRRAGHRAIVFFSDGAPNTFNGRFTLVGGGTAEGNLYSSVGVGDKAEWIYDAGSYNGAATHVPSIAELPTTDLSGAVKAESHNKKRSYDHKPVADYLMCEVNEAARNMTENVANMARNDDITVYAIGFGGEINTRQMFDPKCAETYNEIGATIMKRLANTKDSDSYNAAQPVGIYCEAPDANALKMCFDQVASAMLRISK